MNVWCKSCGRLAGECRGHEAPACPSVNRGSACDLVRDHKGPHINFAPNGTLGWEGA